MGGVGLLGLVLAAWLGGGAGGGRLEPVGEKVPLLPTAHVPDGTDVRYNSNPPTSGDHWVTPAEWGAYDEPLPDEVLVHNIEHGGTWISYDGVADQTVARLQDLADRYPLAVIVTPRPRNDHPIAVASWGRLLTLDRFDEAKILRFIRANVNNSPEQLASLNQPPVQVGSPFPDFVLGEVTDAGLRQISTASLRSRPSIVWFTTSYCTPCQIGATRVAALDDELGGQAFDVLMVFVDPNEGEGDVLDWKRRFARDDWLVALDTDDLVTRAGVRALDDKYLLDRSGRITDHDAQVVTDDYLDRIRAAVGGP